MREILFKAIEEETGKWIKGWLRGKEVDSMGPTITTNCGSYNVPVKDGTVCQFTGLSDKDGDKIFDGDLLSYDGPFSDQRTTIKRAVSIGVFVVVFSYGYVGGWVVENNGECLNIGTRSNHFKLTGRNVHDGGQDED